MHDVVRMPTAKLKELFALTAKQMSMSPGIVEKDFWVVWTLDYLFARSPWRTQLAFKGTPERGLPPGRYSRHYYDLWCLCQSDVKERAFGDIPLLDAVVDFKRKFYRCNWAHYELATAAAISLMPPEHALSALESDYRHMQNMIFGPRPPFSEIVDTVRNLEAEIHGKGARVN